MKFRIARYLGAAAAASVAFGAAPQLLAQATLMPPAMLSVSCEWVKAGMGPAHDQHEVGWARASEAVKGTASALAVQSMTGPGETCWLTAVASYDQIGKNLALYNADPVYSRALPSLVGTDAQYISDGRNYIAVLRTDLSAGEMPNVLSRRVTTWSEWRIRFGTEPAFVAAVKAYRAAATRAGANPEFRVYQVVQGAPAVTFWFFSSQASMAGFDAAMANEPKLAAAYTPDDIKVFDEATTKSIVFMSSNVWSYSSAQSALTPEQRASDPFWKLKPVAPKRP
jgi:hypothetical protein